MSDQITPDMVASAIRRDARFRDIDLALDLEASLAGNRPLAALVSKLKADLWSAVQEFASSNCGDFSLMQGLQSRVFRCMCAIETFEAILTQAQFAHASIQAEDLAASERVD